VLEDVGGRLHGHDVVHDQLAQSGLQSIVIRQFGARIFRVFTQSD
jgi:hypothetical protein